MRAIRQSDIDIAKAEVEILRSLGMEPDEDALLLASLDQPPAATPEEQAEPTVEVNGHPVHTTEAVAGEYSKIFGGELILPATEDSDAPDELDIEVVVPPSRDNTLMHVYLGGMLSKLAFDEPAEGKGGRKVDVVATRAPANVVPYRGITVAQLKELRRSLDAARTEADARSGKTLKDIAEMDSPTFHDND